jgi:transposase-like protein
MPAPLSALQLRRQDAVKRDLAGAPIAAICRELGCAKSWLYTWKTRYEAPEPPWSQERARRPRTTPTTTPAAVAMAIVRLRERCSPGVSAQVIRDHLRRHQGASIPSRRPIARILKRHATEVPSHALLSSVSRCSWRCGAASRRGSARRGLSSQRRKRYDGAASRLCPRGGGGGPLAFRVCEASRRRIDGVTSHRPAGGRQTTHRDWGAGC